MLNGILYVLTTGCRWADIPREYGHPTTVWRRLRRLQEEGIWQKILKVLLELGYSRGKIDLSLTAVDSTTIKAQKGREFVGRDGHKKIKGTKLHALTTKARGRPRTRPGEIAAET